MPYLLPNITSVFPMQFFVTKKKRQIEKDYQKPRDDKPVWICKRNFFALRDASGESAQIASRGLAEAFGANSIKTSSAASLSASFVFPFYRLPLFIFIVFETHVLNRACRLFFEPLSGFPSDIFVPRWLATTRAQPTASLKCPHSSIVYVPKKQTICRVVSGLVLMSCLFSKYISFRCCFKRV